nr:reverse transcriptase domain-containing protein [Tanacetum cinerariifolium]
MPTRSVRQNPITPYSEPERFIHQTLRKKKRRNPFIPIEDQGKNRAIAPTPGAAILAIDLGDNFTVKGHHLSMIKDRQFDGRLRADPHKHIAKFVKICGMFRYGNTNADAIKLKLFPSSLAEEPRFDKSIQAILDAKGIFLYITPNETHQLLEDRVLLKLDWTKENKTKPLRKTVAFAEEDENAPLLEKMEALTTRIDLQFKEIKGDMKEMRDGCKEEEANYRRTQGGRSKLCIQRISRKLLWLKF